MPWSGGLWGGEQGGSSYHFINISQEKSHHIDGGATSRPRHRIVEDGKEYAEEDIAPGGDYIKLLLLPKPFTPDFRQNWEVYRAEYWERENERRAELRKRVRARQREIAREEGGWLWWTGWRGWKRARGLTSTSRNDVEKSSHLSQQQLQQQRRRRPSSLLQPSSFRGRESTHSRSSSRSTTPTPELEERLRHAERERRWSGSTAGSTNSRQSSLRKSQLAVGTKQALRRPVGGMGSRPSTSEGKDKGNEADGEGT